MPLHADGLVDLSSLGSVLPLCHLLNAISSQVAWGSPCLVPWVLSAGRELVLKQQSSCFAVRSPEAAP